ncbi:MAG: glucuronate isomerase [Phycisphaerae bacterium]|nr:glucuronate isomerase [Phycisphaerae bacterium]
MANDAFLTEDFLLESEQARQLYHDYAQKMPIVDYHCHLLPQEVAEDKRWDNVAQIWLGGDHYKWRTMRSNGIDERFCTGDASDWEKFSAFAETMPYLLRNPMYHWSHLELKRYFGISDRLLSPDTAKGIWDDCNAKIADENFCARGLMKQSNVALVCTTDDPIDDLAYHQAVAADASFDIQMLPTWRPDKGMAVEQPELFNAWVDKLAAAADVEIKDFDSYMTAMCKRHDFFHSVGCRLSDHGIETVYAEPYTQAEIEGIFDEIRGGKELNPRQILQFKSAMLYEFGLMDAGKNWTQQIHYGVIRNNNSRMFAKLGPDIGFDSIGDFEIARPLSRLLGRLDNAGNLAKTILYNINPRDNHVLATMLGNFQGGSVPGKIQFGSGWWFLDQLDGMTRQMEALSVLGLLSRFVGMLTDSRSFLSYTRHEYFRRLLCNILGGEMAGGLIPNDMNLVGPMVEDISYYNAASYFGFNLPGRQ